MIDLKKGYTIETKNFKKVVVEEKIGEGGQGAVYKVNYDGKTKALKWYSGRKFKSPQKFYANLEKIIKLGKPANTFLWPEDITKHDGTAFGYIMELRPPEYKDFIKILLGKEVFSSTAALVNAAIQITEGFRELHLKGYSYQDLNDGNFFINPVNGNILICDNDNVSEFGKSSGIAGKVRYMAPEIISKNSQPDKYTDRFSLSVVLYLLLTNNHPFEGKAGSPVCMDARHEKKIFVENPVFVWDPDDSSNRPVHDRHTGSIIRWKLLPEYIQDLFIKTFSKDAILIEPSSRIMEKDWLDNFNRMKSEIYMCPCGEEYFLDPEKKNPCPECNLIKE